jgi:tetratricopeptide (TPR) repeat protein
MDAFISHSSADNAVAVRLEKDLEAEGLEIWVDSSETRAGALLGPQLHEKIRDSRILILLWSRPAAASRWVNMEWLTAFHENRLIVPYVLDDTPLPQCLRNVLYLDVGRDWPDSIGCLARTIRDAPDAANQMAPVVKGGGDPELQQAIQEIVKGQRAVLGHLGNRDPEAAKNEQKSLDRLMDVAREKWPLDTMLVNLDGYHLKNAYQTKHRHAIQAGRGPKDPLLDQAEKRFFEVLYIDPNDHAALNGLGNTHLFLRDLDTAEFFTRRAIALAKREGADYRAYEHDLGLIMHFKGE